jgi:hypothetical protein
MNLNPAELLNPVFMKGNSVTVVPGIIFTMQPPMQSPPPIIGIEVDQTWNGDDETMDEP